MNWGLITGLVLPFVVGTFTVAYKWPNFFKFIGSASIKGALAFSVLAAIYYLGRQHGMSEAKKLTAANLPLPENVADVGSPYHWFFIVAPISVMAYVFFVEHVIEMIRNEENQKNK